MNERFKKITSRINKFFHGFYFGILFVGLVAWSCDYYYIGKSREEIEKELSEIMFEADSILMDLSLTIDSLTIKN